MRIRKTFSCNIEDCTNTHLAKGYCKNHYIKFGKTKKCIMEGCERNHHAKGYCCTHMS